MMEQTENQESQRIRSEYARRDQSGKAALYAWHRVDVRLHHAVRERAMAALLADTMGADLARVDVTDIGCGTGSFLRTLVEWGAAPERMRGTELLADRLDLARRRSPPTMEWHHGGSATLDDASADLVSAQTVFSSILAPGARSELAAEMWRLLRPGGWIMVFDFRFNNPANPQVRRVARAELAALFPATETRYRSLLLAPPVARRLARWRLPSLLHQGLEACCPFLRTHFIFMARKPAGTNR